MQRCITVYDPTADAQERWPDWSIQFTDLAGISAVHSARQKTILLDRSYWYGEEDRGMAAAVAFLDLGYHNEKGALCQEQIRQARWLAQIRLDREEDRQVDTPRDPR